MELPCRKPANVRPFPFRKGPVLPRTLATFDTLGLYVRMVGCVVKRSTQPTGDPSERHQSRTQSRDFLKAIIAAPVNFEIFLAPLAHRALGSKCQVLDQLSTNQAISLELSTVDTALTCSVASLVSP